MSKVQQAKDAQGYVKAPQQCNRCKHYKFDVVSRNLWIGDPYTVEKNRRCAIGLFAVRPTDSCARFERVDEAIKEVTR